MLSRSFEPGAPAAAGEVPLCVPTIGGNEWTYVKECLDTEMVSSVGGYVGRFEEACARLTGTRRAVATVNGTAALHIALLVAGVRPGDEVLVSTLTFIAPVNAIRYAGATPIFIDAEPDYWQMSAEQVRAYLATECSYDGSVLRNTRTGRRVAAVLPVHILGHPVDMDTLLSVAREYGLPVIEDATESLGAVYRGRDVGGLGDAGCLSFNGNKLITTGGGGMIVTNSHAFADRAKYLTTQAKDDPLEYVHGEVGFNYRLTNVAAAIGCAQTEQIGAFLGKKRVIAERYAEGLADVSGVTLMPEAPWARSALWLYTILVDEERFGMSSRELLRRLANDGIQTRPLWQPAHISPAHADAPRFSCPVASRLHRDALSLPSSVSLNETDQARVVTAIRNEAR